MKTRNNIELPQAEKQKQEQIYNLNHLLHLGQQTFIGNFMPNVDTDMLPTNVVQNTVPYTGKIDTYRDDRHSRSYHPYHRDHESNKYDHYKDHRSYESRSNGSHSNDYSKHSNYKNSRRHYY